MATASLRLTGNVIFNNATGNARMQMEQIGFPAYVISTGRLDAARLPLEPSITGNLTPTANILYSLGNATHRWKELYLAGNTLFLGNSVISESSGGGIAINAGSAVALGQTRVLGNLVVEGNLTVLGGNVVEIQTETQITDQLIVTNAGTGPALIVEQTGVQDIATFKDDGNVVVRIHDGSGAMSVGGDVAAPLGALHVVGNVYASGTYVGNGASLTTLNASAVTTGTQVRIGEGAGQTSQGQNAVAVGRLAGNVAQGSSAVAIGVNAGANVQAIDSIAIGNLAGSNTQGIRTISVGRDAGMAFQGNNSVAIGYAAGATSQGPDAVAISISAGQITQGPNGVAIGSGAGQTTQGSCAVAVGRIAGCISQGSSAVAIGMNAGYSNQGIRTTAVGPEAAQWSQGNAAVAVGANAGYSNQGINAVAIGNAAGFWNQASNSIVINATGGVLNNTTANSCVIKPVRHVANIARRFVLYDDASGEISTNSANVVIDASNRVGIGTTTPGRPLHIFGNVQVQHGVANGIGQTELRIGTNGLNSGSDVGLLLGAGTVDPANPLFFPFAFIDTHNGGVSPVPPILFRINGTERMRIATDGNVGIGTASPTAALHVERAIGTSPPNEGHIYAFNPTNSANQHATVGIRVAGSAAGNPYLSYDVAAETGWSAGMLNSDNSYRIRESWNFTINDRFVILPGGNVGIGTASPAYTLDVNGSAFIGSSSINATGGRLIVRGYGQQTITALNTSGNMGGSLLLRTTDGLVYSGGAVVFGASQGDFAMIKGGLTNGGGNTLGHLVFATRNSSADSTLTTRMVIQANGNVGIGALAPDYKLDVVGAVRVTDNLFFNDQVQNNMITLRGSTALDSTSSHGFGIGGSQMRYNVPSPNSHIWYASTTAIMTLASTGNLTITGTYSPSDTRIKKAIRDLDDAEALETLRRLKPVSYGYVDPEGRGVAAGTEVIGFIAQDVAEVLPHAAVTTNTAFVPSVFAPATRMSDSVFSLVSDQQEIPFGPGARVQIFWHDEDAVRKDAVVKCVAVPTPTSFEFEPEPGSLVIPDEVTVIGHEVDDFHTLKKDVIFTVVTAATQELDRQLQAARAETESLRAETESLRTTLESVLTRLAALEAS